jgi:hypothetical protein
VKFSKLNKSERERGRLMYPLKDFLKFGHKNAIKLKNRVPTQIFSLPQIPSLKEIANNRASIV